MHAFLIHSVFFGCVVRLPAVTLLIKDIIFLPMQIKLVNQSIHMSEFSQVLEET